MYQLVFYFFYYYHKTHQGNNPRITGASAVSSTVFMQLFCFGCIVQHFTGWGILGKPMSEDYTTNKLLLLPFALLFMLPFLFYYSKKRTREIAQSWPADQKVLTFKNGVIIF